MLMNNLDPEVAEDPDHLIVYGGTGRAARSWEAFDAIVAELRRLEDDETLLIQSGKPVGVFRTTTDAPRVLIANKADRGVSAVLPEGAVPLRGLSQDAGARLTELLAATIAGDIRTEETSEVLGSLRQRDLVDRARACADATLDALSQGHSPEYAVTHCHAALDALADLTGETTPEDVLARLFSTFCVGK